MKHKNRLTLVKDLGFFKGGRMGIFLCECGYRKILNITQVKIGKTVSCGCLRDELLRKMAKKSCHGYRHHPLYQVWAAMLRRCNSKTAKSYKDYGGRGIKVCKSWHNVIKFIEWCLVNGWKKGLHLDRKKNNKGYNQNNCRFVTRQVNANNTRANRWITYLGERKTISQWAEYLNINRGTLNSRIGKGWPIKRCLNEKVRKY